MKRIRDRGKWVCYNTVRTVAPHAMNTRHAADGSWRPALLAASRLPALRGRQPVLR
jgi:hypothetical protein